MNLEESILQEHSKQRTMAIVRWIGSDASRFRQLMELFLGGEPVVTQRAAWILRYCAEEHPGLVGRWIRPMVDRMQKPGVHDAARRNVVCILRNAEIPRSMLGKVVTVCFDYLVSNDIPVAVRVHSLSVLQNIADREPGIRNELVSVVESLIPFASPGLRSRGKAALRHFRGVNTNRLRR